MSAADPQSLDAKEVQRRLDELLWYHTIDVVPGAVTRGWFDLRHALPKIPFPDVRGRRCLDVGTWDGFYAYELEQRGAGEVVAVDLPDMRGIDWPPEVLADPSFDPTLSDEQPRAAGFHLVNEIRRSSVAWRGLSIYELDPATVGTFDLVLVGSLLVHLRDPIRALDAVRQVVAPGGHLLLVDYIHPSVNVLGRGRPLFELRGEGSDFQWWLASDLGLQQVLKVAGFTIDTASDHFLLRPGEHYPATTFRAHTRRDYVSRALNWRFARDATFGGHLHRAYLCRPRF
ncbi:MAG: class I SAM-dependent methyltransferase [Acidimicrobiales bacterium]|nr:class I SAM-dependent methyltransferase [Acidimicrobiales bacterium]